MRVAVFGLWHLGCVTAACVAAAGNDVVAFDLDSSVIGNLRRGMPPISEPGLEAMIAQEVAAGRLKFSENPAEALRDAAVLWVCFDTPVNDEDEADVEFVRRRLDRIGSHIHPTTVVLISSQVPVGFTRSLSRTAWCGKLRFAYSPENLRLGKATDAFRKPDRVVIGTDDESTRPLLTELFAAFTNHIEWMGLESAEMTKHAINAFLATSVTFANELARLCEVVGADAREVERGLKSEGRIGIKAYLAPGAAFSGGTLGRDLRFLERLGREGGVDTPFFNGVLAGNERHKDWSRRTVERLLAGIREPVVAVLGLTYKPGTDTLRRSASVELCRWMAGQGCRVKAFDPAVGQLPAELSRFIELSPNARDALGEADLAVIATQWPEFARIVPADFTTLMRRPAVIDPNWFLAKILMDDRAIEYVATGRAPLPNPPPA